MYYLIYNYPHNFNKYLTLLVVNSKNPSCQVAEVVETSDRSSEEDASDSE